MAPPCSQGPAAPFETLPPHFLTLHFLRTGVSTALLASRFLTSPPWQFKNITMWATELSRAGAKPGVTNSLLTRVGNGVGVITCQLRHSASQLSIHAEQEIQHARYITVYRWNQTVRPSRRWVDSFKTGLIETGWDGVDWIHLAHDKHQ
jgi:hypothetical protein